MPTAEIIIINIDPARSDKLTSLVGDEVVVGLITIFFVGAVLPKTLATSWLWTVVTPKASLLFLLISVISADDCLLVDGINSITRGAVLVVLFWLTIGLPADVFMPKLPNQLPNTLINKTPNHPDNPNWLALNVTIPVAC